MLRSLVGSEMCIRDRGEGEGEGEVADAMPAAAAAGMLQLGGVAIPGQTIRWQSESSPMNMSPEQVVLHRGSCTGTAIVMAAVARSVGLPVRIAGCSQSKAGDDHHWVEFWDNVTSSGPFKTSWHTKEGTSLGNSGGPWDAPSGPMSGCLRALVPNDDLNTMWASSWSSREFMPLQWNTGGTKPNDALQREVSFVGGVNLCGDYCTAWGCGANQTDRWEQHQCHVIA
eukprot:TRINITY_DN4660_c0_g2_i6.p2 TRINITY_DN4660_c0_g2~~TRINITY_DN4660_c0_g2_i6.p2  ORF type:complete len:227 (-),score=48.07 TRINITY_DN4660_c0_g2_i6:199-879(-)